MSGKFAMHIVNNFRLCPVKCVCPPEDVGLAFFFSLLFHFLPVKLGKAFSQDYALC